MIVPSLMKTRSTESDEDSKYRVESLIKVYFKIRRTLTNHIMPGLQIFKHIKQTYGIDTLRNIRKWEFFVRKESSTFEQLHFLHNCRRQNILPNSINYQPPIKTDLAQRTAQSNGRRMLNALISDAHNCLRIYQQKLHGYRSSIKDNPR